MADAPGAPLPTTEKALERDENVVMRPTQAPYEKDQSVLEARGNLAAIEVNADGDTSALWDHSGCACVSLVNLDVEDTA